jgi:hypothetical protein
MRGGFGGTVKPVIVVYIAEFAPLDDELLGSEIPKKRPFLLNYPPLEVVFQTRRLLFSFLSETRKPSRCSRRLGSSWSVTRRKLRRSF